MIDGQISGLWHCFYACFNMKYLPKAAVLAILCQCFLFNAIAQRADTADRQKIRVLNQQLEDAFNANDMQKVADFYADDAEMIYDNGYTVKGRAVMDNYWKALKDKGRGWKLTAVEIGGSGDLLFELGVS